uniref:Uncharacterized protein n=1 Tax=Ursus maritimus TaxID=29073 RepID=A0A452V975_URSMA
IVPTGHSKSPGGPRPEPRSRPCSSAVSPGCPGARPSQTRLLAHSDGDVVVPVIFGDQGHHRPVQGRIGGVDRDELFSAVLGQPVHLNGVAYSVGQKEHFNLGKSATGVIIRCVPSKQKHREKWYFFSLLFIII